MDAVDLIAAEGYRLLPEYRFEPGTGQWRHASAVQAPLHLSELCYGPDGAMACPRGRAQAGEDAFAGYLADARAVLASRRADVDDGPTGLHPGAEALRWFSLPPACLGGEDRFLASPGPVTPPGDTPAGILEGVTGRAV